MIEKFKTATLNKNRFLLLIVESSKSEDFFRKALLRGKDLGGHEHGHGIYSIPTINSSDEKLEDFGEGLLDEGEGFYLLDPIETVEAFARPKQGRSIVAQKE